jgi:hypothetical protein
MFYCHKETMRLIRERCARTASLAASLSLLLARYALGAFWLQVGWRRSSTIRARALFKKMIFLFKKHAPDRPTTSECCTAPEHTKHITACWARMHKHTSQVIKFYETFVLL